MHPKIDLDLIQIDVYTALVALGALAGLAAAYAFLRSRSRRASALDAFLDTALVVLAGGWIGARAYHVLTHWSYYAARPEQIVQFGAGGLGIRGGILLGAVLLAVYARVRRLPFGHLADAAALGLALGQAVGWVGAFAQGANYGVVSDSPIALELPDVYGLVEPRFPLQPVETALYGAVLVVLLLLAQPPRAPGRLALVYLLSVSLANALLGFLRGDEALYLGGLRLDQWLDLALAAVALAGLLTLRRRSRSNAQAGPAWRVMG